MRRVSAEPCPPGLSSVLSRRQEKLNEDTTKFKTSWSSFTKLKSYETLRATLAKPLKDRQRCVYCSDSRAADVEHFWPKSLYPQKTYDFGNFLLVCPECNRKKSNQFPLHSGSLPSLINPMFDDPWDVLFFVPTTGLLDARITGQGPDGKVLREERGVATLTILGEILNSTPLLEGRKESWKNLVKVLGELLASDADLPARQREIFGSADTFGLGEFILNREGKENEQVKYLRNSSPTRWSAIRDLPR